MSDKFAFLCPFCESEIRVPVAAAGKSGTCKKCRNKVIVPSRSPMVAAPIVAEKQNSLAIPLASCVASGSAIIWAVCAEANLTPWDYLAIILSSVGLCALIWMIRSAAWAVPVSILMLVGWWAAYAAMDTRTERWKNDNFEYVDVYSRWGHVHKTRRMTILDDEGKLQSMSSGAMSESGKPHGKWHLTLFPSFDSSDSWYWYGEEITEGEWHTRSGR